MPTKRRVGKKRVAKRRVALGNPSQPFQLGGARVHRGKEQVYVMQNGRGFWDSAWKWVKKAAPVALDIFKKSGVGSQLASKIPVIGKYAGDFAKQQGFGYQRGAGLIQPGNAARAMP